MMVGSGMGVMDETTWSQEVRMEGEGEIGLAVRKASAGFVASMATSVATPTTYLGS